MIIDTLFSPLLSLPPLVAVILLGLVIAIISILSTKFLTNQTLMKSLRDKQKKSQEEMKKHKGNPEKLMEIQKGVMDANMKYMMESFKPMLLTFLPIIFIFAWANAHFMYVALAPQTEFSAGLVLDQGISGSITVDTPQGLTAVQQEKNITNETMLFTFTGDIGEYLVTYKVGNKTYDQPILISTKQEYTPASKVVDDGVVKQAVIQYSKLKLINLFGWKLSWLWTYILVVIFSSMLFKKVFNVH